MRRCLAFLVLLSSLSSAANAFAADASDEQGPPRRNVTLAADTWQPILGIAAARGELRLSRDVGLGMWLGAGAIRREGGGDHLAVWRGCGTATTRCEHNGFVGGAVQALYYAIGTFSGTHAWQIGAEAAISQEWGDASRTLATPAAVFGYKLVTGAGFTFNPQTAIGYTFGDHPRGLSSRFVVAVGWSF